MSEIRKVRFSSAPVAHCHRCNGDRYLIEGDGPVVCVLCVHLLGKVAADPDVGGDRLIKALVERHEGIVRLIGAGDGRLAWEWMG